eukprot:TRINITY_DN7389_c0_g1_i1.p1 TRINITY_DN7389_c0_g1~~TRINITY_DN7389_c0_g1_i1.p1  ORF type:complete len:200 (-),score=33.66 TRINITY_DN7389_c0_g1_i1:72-671(-)
MEWSGYFRELLSDFKMDRGRKIRKCVNYCMLNVKYAKELIDIWSEFVVQPDINFEARLTIFYVVHDLFSQFQSNHQTISQFLPHLHQQLPLVLPEMYSLILDEKSKVDVERSIMMWQSIFGREYIFSIIVSLSDRGSLFDKSVSLYGVVSEYESYADPKFVSERLMWEKKLISVWKALIDEHKLHRDVLVKRIDSDTQG